MRSEKKSNNVAISKSINITTTTYLANTVQRLSMIYIQHTYMVETLKRLRNSWALALFKHQMKERIRPKAKNRSLTLIVARQRVQACDLRALSAHDVEKLLTYRDEMSEKRPTMMMMMRTRADWDFCYLFIRDQKSAVKVYEHHEG